MENPFQTLNKKPIEKTITKEDLYKAFALHAFLIANASNLDEKDYMRLVGEFMGATV